MPADPSIRDSIGRDIKVTVTTVQHMEIWVTGRAAAAEPPPSAAKWIRQAAGQELVAETLRALAGMLPWLAVAGAGALARRARRAALAAPPGSRRALPSSAKVVPQRPEAEGQL